MNLIMGKVAVNSRAHGCLKLNKSWSLIWILNDKAPGAQP